MTVYIHALREEGDEIRHLQRWCNNISIHALREEGDEGAAQIAGHLAAFLSTPSARRATISSDVIFISLSISIHALREEGDLLLFPNSPSRYKFLSTPSARRATRGQRRPSDQPKYFYPRPPRGGRPVYCISKKRRTTFLSTPSARRATQSGRPRWTGPRNFYPRPPRGGRLDRPSPSGWAMTISIHALREEGDAIG